MGLSSVWGGRRGVPDSYRLNSPRWSASAPKGGLRELLLDRANAHHGATPIKAHLGGGDCKEVSPSSTTQGRLYSGPPVARAVQCTATHDRPMRRCLLGGRLTRAQQSPRGGCSSAPSPPSWIGFLSIPLCSLFLEHNGFTERDHCPPICLHLLTIQDLFLVLGAKKLFLLNTS